MTALVTDNCPLVSSAPNGIAKLRELILALAVSGRLVAQDPAEESALSLLEATKLAREGTSKRPKASVMPPPDIKLPEGWAQSPLANLALKLTDGSHNPPPDAGVGFPMLSSQNIRDGVIDFSSPSRFIAPEGFEKEDARTRAIPGDVLLTIVASIGRSAVVPTDAPKFALQRSVAVIQTLLVPAYLCLFLRSPGAVAYYWQHAAGTAQKGIYLGKLGELSIAVPPLAEQHRIVAKVDELMALCDRLEAEQADAEAAHAKLVEALLARLTQARDAADFRASWQQLAKHFHTLFTTEASVDALRVAVLELGVFGRLATGCPADEPSVRLLGRLGGKAIEGELAPLPANWCWTTFSAICEIRSSLVRPEDHLDAPQVAPDCIEKGTGRLLIQRTVRESGVRGPNSRFGAGQIVYSKIRPSLSKVVLVDFSGLCSADMYPIDSKIDAKYQLYLMLSEPFLRQVRVAENRVKMPKLNQESLNEFRVPLPPLAEQRRIVAKVTELLALCDLLKARIAAAGAKHVQLAEAIVQQATAPAETCAA